MKPEFRQVARNYHLFCSFSVSESTSYTVIAWLIVRHEKRLSAISVGILDIYSAPSGNL